VGDEERDCAGDEYLLTVTPLDGEAVAILLERIGADGSSGTLELEGDLEDARSLVLHLSSEGDCVRQVEVVRPAEGEGIEESIADPPPASLP
jgi:hypothetical protein